VQIRDFLIAIDYESPFRGEIIIAPGFSPGTVRKKAPANFPLPKMNYRNRRMIAREGLGVGSRIIFIEP